MDALSEIFKLVRFNSAIFFKGKFTAPWSFASPQASSIAGALGQGSEPCFWVLYSPPPK